MLKAFIKRHPEAGVALQTAMSADLSRKIEASRGQDDRYRIWLQAALAAGEVTPIERDKLERYFEAPAKSEACSGPGTREQSERKHGIVLVQLISCPRRLSQPLGPDIPLAYASSPPLILTKRAVQAVVVASPNLQVTVGNW